MILFWVCTLAFVVILVKGEQSVYKISDLKYSIFDQHHLTAFHESESQNLDSNPFQSDYTKAPRKYNTSRCIENLIRIKEKLQQSDKQAMMRKNI